MSTKDPVTPSWLASEPVVLIQGFIQAVIIAVSAFGLNLTATQTAAISIVAAAVLSLITREMVTPVTNAATQTLVTTTTAPAATTTTTATTGSVAVAAKGAPATAAAPATSAADPKAAIDV